MSKTRVPKRRFVIRDQDNDNYGPCNSVKECEQKLVDAFEDIDEGLPNYRYTLYEILGEFTLSIVPQPPTNTPPPKITIKRVGGQGGKK